jgi:hypothetical protein
MDFNFLVITSFAGKIFVPKLIILSESQGTLLMAELYLKVSYSLAFLSDNTIFELCQGIKGNL